MSLQLFHIAWASNLCTEKDYKNVRKEIAKYYQLNIFKDGSKAGEDFLKNCLKLSDENKAGILNDLSLIDYASEHILDCNEHLNKINWGISIFFTLINGQSF